MVYAETAAKHSIEHVDEYDFNEKVPAWNDEGTLTNEEKVLITQSVKEVGECAPAENPQTAILSGLIWNSSARERIMRISLEISRNGCIFSAASSN